MADDLLEDMEEGSEIQEEDRSEEGGATKFSRLKLRIRQLAGNRKRLMMIAAGLLILLLSAGGLWFFFSGSDQETPAAPDKASVTGDDAATAQVPQIVFEDIVVLEPFERIELKSSSAMKYINLGICLELADHRYRKMVVTVEDRLRKIIQGQLREMTWIELRNPEGKIKLKYELLKRINSIFPKVTVRNLYFTNFLMQ